MLVGRCSSQLSSHKLQAKLKKSQAPSVPGFPTSPLSPATTYVVLLKKNHMQLTEAVTLEGNSGKRTCPVCPGLPWGAPWRDPQFRGLLPEFLLRPAHSLHLCTEVSPPYLQSTRYSFQNQAACCR